MDASRSSLVCKRLRWKGGEIQSAPDAGATFKKVATRDSFFAPTETRQKPREQKRTNVNGFGRESLILLEFPGRALRS